MNTSTIFGMFIGVNMPSNPDSFTKITNKSIYSLLWVDLCIPNTRIHEQYAINYKILELLYVC